MILQLGSICMYTLPSTFSGMQCQCWIICCILCFAICIQKPCRWQTCIPCLVDFHVGYTQAVCGTATAGWAKVLLRRKINSSCWCPAIQAAVCCFLSHEQWHHEVPFCGITCKPPICSKLCSKFDLCLLLSCKPWPMWSKMTFLN